MTTNVSNVLHDYFEYIQWCPVQEYVNIVGLTTDADWVEFRRDSATGESSHRHVSRVPQRIALSFGETEL